MVGGYLADRMRRTAIFIGKGGRRRVSPYTARTPIDVLEEGTYRTLGWKISWATERKQRTTHIKFATFATRS